MGLNTDVWKARMRTRWWEKDWISFKRLCAMVSWTWITRYFIETHEFILFKTELNFESNFQLARTFSSSERKKNKVKPKKKRQVLDLTRWKRYVSCHPNITAYPLFAHKNRPIDKHTTAIWWWSWRDVVFIKDMDKR